MQLHPDTLNFLHLIAETNTRHFFGIIKPLYEQVREQLQLFTQDVITRLQEQDPALEKKLKPKDCLFRIYRDARRLKEGDPVYKINFGFSISPSGKNDTRAGYYLHIQPGASFFGGGVYRPESKELLNLRHYILEHSKEYLATTQHPTFKKRFGDIGGAMLSRPPKGFSASHPNIALVMHKQYLIQKHYSDKEILSEDFINTFLEDCKLAMPFFHYLNTGYTYDERQ